MHSIITALPNAFKLVFWLKPIVRWVSRCTKCCIPYIACQSLLLSTTVLNDMNKSGYPDFGTTCTQIHTVTV